MECLQSKFSLVACFCFDIVFPRLHQEAHGFPVDPKEEKTQRLRKYISHHRFDTVCLTENNIHWKNIPVQNRLYERTRGWYQDLHISTAYYDAHETQEAAQVGGVTIWSINKAAHRATEKGVDPRGLGRWAWTLYRGRQGRNLRIIAGYRPVKNETGALSAWSQHKAYLQDTDIDDCPRALFTTDLVEELEKWQEKGDQIVLALDVNDNIYNSKFTTAMQEIGPTEICTERHGPHAPPTYNRERTRSTGSMFQKH